MLTLQCSALVGLTVCFALVQANEQCKIVGNNGTIVYNEGRKGYDDCMQYKKGNLAIKHNSTCSINEETFFEGMAGYDECIQIAKDMANFIKNIFLSFFAFGFLYVVAFFVCACGCFGAYCCGCIYLIGRATRKSPAPPSMATYELLSEKSTAASTPTSMQYA